MGVKLTKKRHYNNGDLVILSNERKAIIVGNYKDMYGGTSGYNEYEVLIEYRNEDNKTEWYTRAWIYNTNIKGCIDNLSNIIDKL